MFNAKTKKAVFALFIGIAWSCWLGPKGNYNKVSFANTHAQSSFSIVLDDSKFMNEYRKKVSQWTTYWNNKCRDLTWHENQEMLFNFFLLKTKKSTTTSRVLEPASKKTIDENDSFELKEHPIFVQGFFLK